MAAIGKTVLYKLIVTNTGNTNLTFEKLIDKHCESITGGPAGEVKPGESTVYFCKHTITEADYKFTQFYENKATITGKPPRNFGSTSTHESNIVVVKAPKPNERPNGEVNATCTSITFTYKKFPNLPNNQVTEKVFINGNLILTKVFTFNGPSGSDTIAIHVPPGPHNVVDGKAIWNTNGFSGNWDIHVGVACSAEPSFAIGKFQKIEGSAGEFVTTPLSGSVGQTILYRIAVKNTGNVPETFSNFTDAHCSGIAGGPSGALGIEESATYTCSHTIGLADAGHEYENSATVTGTPSEGAKSTQTSNTVVTNVPFVPEPRFTIEKEQKIDGGQAPFTENEVIGGAGQTVDYLITVRNTGNVPLTLSNFEDAGCTGIAGGPPGELEPGESTTYTCHYELVSSPGVHGNTATVTGTPPVVDGSPVTHTSNEVVAVTARPEFSIVKGQRVEPTAEFTNVTLAAELGTTVEYAISVHNLGNVPLTFGPLSDPNCENVSGGPTGALAPGEGAEYRCQHTIDEADQTAESYTNQASVTGTPPAGDGSPQTEFSNTVTVNTKAKR